MSFYKSYYYYTYYNNNFLKLKFYVCKSIHIRSFKSNIPFLMPYVSSSWHSKCRFVTRINRITFINGNFSKEGNGRFLTLYRLFEAIHIFNRLYLRLEIIYCIGIFSFLEEDARDIMIVVPPQSSIRL